MSIVGATDYLLENVAGQFNGDLDMYPSRAERLKGITSNVPNNGHLDKCLNEKNFKSGEHLAYRKYKKSGDYWNCTPKTDYTYFKFSSCRRVLAPGVTAMPNMSRRGLGNYMIEKVSNHEEAEQLNLLDDEKIDSLNDSTNADRRPRDKHSKCDTIPSLLGSRIAQRPISFERGLNDLSVCICKETLTHQQRAGFVKVVTTNGCLLAVPGTAFCQNTLLGSAER
uniref:Uncharacterized protein n=1 Tax=Glossina palpalis gambiensis TaxID=67801 RepID=A0A1B0B0X9_9MUSC